MKEPPKQGDKINVFTKDGKTNTEILGELIDTTPSGDFVFKKGKEETFPVDFKNFIGLEPKEWSKFKTAINKYNRTNNDRIVIAHASNTLKGHIAHLIWESGERDDVPLDDLL